jgi:arsenate reductase
MKKTILFLCTGNAVRSQMAEGLANALHGDEVTAVSAGSRPAGWVHPLAVRAMAEIGIDISAAESKSAAQFADQPLDVVVTVCDSAAQDCPLWPGARRLEHWPIEDPSSYPGIPAHPLEAFIATRNDLAQRIAALVKTL